MHRLGLARYVHGRLPKTGSLSAFAVAAALVGIAILLRFPLDQASQGPLPPYITLYPAIVIAAFVGGIRVGLAAMLASALAAWLLWIAPPIPNALTLDRVMTGAVFLFTGAVTVLSGGLARNFLDELALAEQSRAKVAQESVHRIKNLIAVVQAISRKISASAQDVGSYRDRLDARLNALAIAQEVLLRGDGDPVKLGQLVSAALAPFLPNPRLDVAVTVDAIVPNEVITALSLALYELATNSVKYGGLASPSGNVRLEARQSNDQCFLEWREAGLNQVPVGDSPGFGTQLIRSGLASLQGGNVSYAVTAQAVSCVFSWPIDPSPVTHPAPLKAES